MFKKRSSKGKTKVNARKREVNTIERSDGDDDTVLVTSTKAKQRGSTFESNSSNKKRQRSDSDTVHATRTYASNRDSAPVQYSGGATAELQIDTEKERDARALHEKNVEFNESAQAVVGTATPNAPEKEYRGATNQVNRLSKTKEQIANNKVTGAFGPIRAPTNIRMTNRFDYQPDVCKDYKETGFCGYGDSCKFLHDRSDYKAGWQLENDWNEQQRKRQKRIAKGLPAEGEESSDNNKDEELPFACHICRLRFDNPVVTQCGHYFCSKCALQRFRKNPKCAICLENTKGIFNRAVKIIERDAKQANTE